jgi:hypothetical protein
VTGGLFTLLDTGNPKGSVDDAETADEEAKGSLKILRRELILDEMNSYNS